MEWRRRLHEHGEPVSYVDTPKRSYEAWEQETASDHRRCTVDSPRCTMTPPAYELTGLDGAPVIVALGGISATRHVTATGGDGSPGWWENVVGAGRAIDTTKYRVLSLDYLDAGPADNGNTASTVSTHDQADALAALLDALGIQRVHAIVGASYGGMVALAFAERYGARVERLIAISAAHESHPMSTGIRAVQRRIVKLGLETGRAQDALALARALAMTTYRSAREFAVRFGSDPEADADGSATFPVESYLLHHGEKFARDWRPERFLALSLSADLHHVDPRRIYTPTVLVAVDGDTVVPGEQMEELATQLAAPHRLVHLAAITGHDAFLAEPAKIGPILHHALTTQFLPINSIMNPSHSPTEVNKLGSATRAVRAGIASDQEHGAVVPPIHLSSTFAFAGFGKPRAYDYTRSGNPTRSHLADALTELEHGAATVVTNTGMSAVTLVLQLVKPGDLVLAAHDCYGGTQRLLRALSARGNFDLAFVDLTGPGAEAEIAKRHPQLLWIETPSNPLLRITDVRRVATAGHLAGALVVVDNTFLSPVLQQPLALGADLVVHSTTKYLNGHSDVVGGAVIARDAALGKDLGWWANCLGITGAPFDSYLTLRGIRTLHARLAAHLVNADAVAGALCSHEAVTRVYYPGLTTHPGHDVARAQQSGYGAMVSFELLGGIEAVELFTSQLRCFTLAESLGGVESLIAHPATMTHASMDEQARAVAGIGDSLLRLSVGIELARDLVGDLTSALDQVRDLVLAARLPTVDIAVVTPQHTSVDTCAPEVSLA